MIQIRKVESTEQLAVLKKRYIQEATAPLDGMWLCGFVPAAIHFGLFDDDALVGFFCLNEDGYMLQFLLTEFHQGQALEVFQWIVNGDNSLYGTIKGSFVSTAEPHFLSLCFDCFSTFHVNALMYQLGSANQENPKENALKPISSSHLSQAVDFAVDSIGAPAEWLNGYFLNLINRHELFGVWNNGQLVATGESRGYDEHQMDYADVGVIVAESERGKGLATQVLRELVFMNESNGLRSICSTEKTNVAAQKAIGRAGFIPRNRIIQFHS